MSALFKDQFSKTSEWFSSWNECEQVVALYNLIKKVTPSQACFLSKVLPQLPSSNTSLDIELLEYQANDPNFISNLRKEQPEILIKELVKLLPLLKPCSFLAAKEYVKLTSSIVTNPSFKTFMADDLYQIIFYLSLHPSVSKEDWHQLYIWRSNLEELSTLNKVDSINEHFTTSDSFLPVVQVSDASLSQSVPESREIDVEREFFNVPECFVGSNYLLPPLPQDTFASRKTSNSLSLVDEGALFKDQLGSNDFQQPHPINSYFSNLAAPKQHHALTRTASISSYPSCSDWITHNAHKGNTHKVNQTYLTADHAPLSPQSSGASTGSAGSDLHNLPEDPAMSDVSMWLKSLRLHKYLFIFEKLSYQEMMGLTEDWLAGQGVTKGARNKILINVKKLQERPYLLRTIEKNILSGHDLSQCVSDLKQVIFAPISSNSNVDGQSTRPESGTSCIGVQVATSENYNADGSCEESLPTQISRVLGKLCSQLLVSSRPDSECLLDYLQLLERCSNHYAFSAEQKKKMTFWKQQIQNTWNGLLTKHVNLRCKTSHPQNLPLPFNKPKSKLTQRYSNPINASQSCLTMKPPLVVHQHLQKVSHPNPQFYSPSSTIFPTANICHQAQPFHAIPLQHSEPLPVFGHQSLMPPLQIQIDPQEGRRSYANDPTHEALSQLKIPLGRTQSAPLSSPGAHKSFVPSDALENEVASSPTTEDIHANLESLCLNMMEHALGNSND